MRRLEFVYPPRPQVRWDRVWRVTWLVCLVAFWGGAAGLWGKMAWDMFVGLRGRP